MKRRAVLTVLTALAAALGGAGCSSCSGVVGCREAPHTTIDGRILSEETGRGVEGALITLTESGTTNATSVMTDANGLFSLRLPSPTSAGLSLRVEPAGVPGYTLDSIVCQPVTVSADGCLLPPMVPTPWLPVHALIKLRGPADITVTNAKVEFVRTGGTNWFGPGVADTIRSETDSGGVARLFPPRVYTESLDPLRGDILVLTQGDTLFRRGVELTPVFLVSQRPLILLHIGPSLNYGFTFVDSATRSPVPDVRIRFSRSSGIGIEPAAGEASSNAAGIGALSLQALSAGTVRGTLRLQPPGRPETVIPDFGLTTFDADTTRIIGRWAVGSTGSVYPDPPGQSR